MLLRDLPFLVRAADLALLDAEDFASAGLRAELRLLSEVGSAGVFFVERFGFDFCGLDF